VEKGVLLFRRARDLKSRYLADIVHFSEAGDREKALYLRTSDAA